MVRTLVFHTNNVGSIPSGLNMTSKATRTQLPPLVPICYSRPSTKPRFTAYRFRFVSLVAPLTMLGSPAVSKSPYSPLPKRTLVRRSYTILSWMYYLSSVKKNTDSSTDDHTIPSLTILPSKQRVYTLQKAPMAHKTNSKEQFLFKTYNFSFSFKVPAVHPKIFTSHSACAHGLVLTKRLFPVFETNLLFLKYYRVSYPVTDSNFFRSLS